MTEWKQKVSSLLSRRTCDVVVPRSVVRVVRCCCRRRTKGGHCVRRSDEDKKGEGEG